MLPCVEVFGDRLPDGDTVQARVHADSMKPRRERRSAAEAAQPAIHAEEHVLRQVARVFVVPDKSIAQLINLAPMPFDDDVEGATAPGAACLEQLQIVELRE